MIMEPATPLPTPSASASSVSSVSPSSDQAPSLRSYKSHASNDLPNNHNHHDSSNNNINTNYVTGEQHSAASNLPETTNGINANSAKERSTVPSACVPCRSKHLKCDGQTPCSRCSSNSFECSYVRSRRGFKGPRRNGTQTQTQTQTQSKTPTSTSVAGPVARAACPMINPAAARSTSNVPTGLVTPPDNRHQTLPRVLDLPLFDISQDLINFNTKQFPPGMALPERCIEAFFYHFHPTHPLVVPRAYFMQLRKEKSVKHLEVAMRYVGSFYVPQAPTVAMGLDAERALYHADCPKDAFKVQAMLILAIGLDGYSSQEKALKILLDAQDLAMELGMNRREFATTQCEGSDVLAESWRRTWWEMFVVDGMIAGVHQKSSFRMKDIITDVTLPCEEREYATGEIPPQRTVEEFENASFDGRDVAYSSFAYRIAAIRNLGRVFAVGIMPILDEEIIDRLDAHLVTWRLHLPTSKKDFINPEGQLDEMLFQGHMITEATTVMLHRELSELDSSIAKNITSCAPHTDILPGHSINFHATKTIKAAQAISKLIQLPVPLIKHSHFFTCVVTLASIVHLMCWSAMLPPTYDDDLKQQLRLNTGALKTLWQVWPSAGKAFGQVKGVAQEMYAAKKQAAEVGYWTSLTDEEVMKSLIEDQTIMEDLQLLT